MFIAINKMQYEVCVCRLPFAVCRLPFAVCRFPFAVCRFPFAVCNFPFAVCRLPFAVCRLPETTFVHLARLTSTSEQDGLTNFSLHTCFLISTVFSRDLQLWSRSLWIHVFSLTVSLSSCVLTRIRRTKSEVNSPS